MQHTGVQAINCQGQTFILHPFRSMYWVDQSILLLADLHIGKVNHFRKSGIPVPQGASDANWDRLHYLLTDFSPRQVLILGDLFHSDYNNEWESVRQFTQQFSSISFSLVPGNHDRLEKRHYRDARIELCTDHVLIAPFLFSHHPLEAIPEGQYNLSGHLHPCVRLQGMGRQRLRFPCFYFGRQYGILPAFGEFTGMGEVEVHPGDRVYVITKEKIIEV